MGRPRLGILLPMAALALLGILAGTTASDVEARTVIDGDITLDHDAVWADDTYEVHGNLTVLGGHTLHLSRAAVEIVGDAEGTRRLEVMAGARLIADNTTFRGTPHAIGVEIAGIVSMFTCTLEDMYVSNTTAAVNVTGVWHMEGCVVRDVRNETAIRVTGILEASGCQFSDLGEVTLYFPDPDGARSSYLRGCSLSGKAGATGETYGVLLAWTEATADDAVLNVTDCDLHGFTFGIRAYLDTTAGTLDIRGSTLRRCTNGVVILGNRARVTVSDCMMDGSGNGLQVEVVEVMHSPISLTSRDLILDGFSAGVHITGPATGFKPLLHNITVVDSLQGIFAHGCTVLVEDSSITDCGLCFYVEYGARIEVRRTEHTHRSGDFRPGPESAVVAFSMIDIDSCRWENAQPISEGFLYLMGDDKVELGRIDIADLRPVEVVAWSITKYNDLGRLWVIPEYRTDGHVFKAASNISIYNVSAQRVDLMDRHPPVISDTEPEDGHWSQSSDLTVRGRLQENGSGLASLVVSIEGSGWIVADVGNDGWWEVTFEDVPDGRLTIHVTATDRSGGTSTVDIVDVVVDTLPPPIDLVGGDHVLVNTTDITVTGTTEPLSEVHVWELGVPPDHPYNCNVTVASDAVGVFNATVCLGSGVHSMSITSTDRAGNVGAMTFTVAMDPIPPKLSFLSPRDGVWVNVSRVEFTGSASDGEGPSSWFSGWVNGEEWFVEEDEVGTFTLTVDLVEGPNVVVFKLRDEAGNQVIQRVSVHSDTVPPMITVRVPKEAQFFTTESKVDLQGEVRESNLANLTLNGEPLEDMDGIITHALSIAEGENVFIIRAEDRAGNVAEVTITILRDLTPPVFTYQTELPDGLTMELDGTLYATHGGQGTPMLVFSFQVSEASRVTASDGRGQVEGEGTLSLPVVLDEGENAITITVVDESGNLATPFTYRIVLDTTPPEIRVDDPKGEVRTRDSNYRVRGKVEEGSTLEIDGVAVPVDPDGTFNVQVDLVVGENEFRLVATDRVGLESAKNVTLTRQKEAEEGPGPGAPAALAGLFTVAILSVRRVRRRD